ncbi:hypothetical protein [Pedobacter hartonius]|uniref:Uncharacterized protein n=1 Tax=Pedobacter hartonius TaxID=425514 RepID=A0A1H4FWU4_9SPHI|nr:hypothetical protein [Pedobacter hartonius]SEB01601.1 hypothetical protein SAMN05443550_108180 [Pedobacter hartonius]
MKDLAKYFSIAVVGILSLSACSMGDKGSEKVPDSVKIDTNIKSQQSSPPAKTSDTTLIDSLQTDTAVKTGKKP